MGSNEACVVCGGGVWVYNSPQGWTDVDGDGCHEYEIYDWCDIFGNLEGLHHPDTTAKEACLVCGGGRIASDYQWWEDAYGWNCNKYNEDPDFYCSMYGDIDPNYGYVANDMCAA